MSYPSGFKSKEEYAAYMRDYRKKQREKAEQNKAKIEEMTFKSFGDMEYSWCIKTRRDAGDSEEQAKSYCDGNRQEIRRLIATDMEEKAKNEATIENVTTDVRSDIEPFHDKMAEAYTTYLNYCIKRRTAVFKGTYSQEAIEQHCKELLEKADSQLMASISRQLSRDEGTWPIKDVSQEYADRVYVDQAVYGIPQNYAERYVIAEMIKEGKFADMTKRTYNRESVGSLFGKSRKEILAENYADQPIYGKDAKAREEFQKFEEKQRASGVSMPSNKEQFPKPGKTTVGNLYGKKRKEILDMDKEEE